MNRLPLSIRYWRWCGSHGRVIVSQTTQPTTTPPPNQACRRRQQQRLALVHPVPPKQQPPHRGQCRSRSSPHRRSPNVFTFGHFDRKLGAGKKTVMVFLYYATVFSTAPKHQWTTPTTYLAPTHMCDLSKQLCLLFLVDSNSNNNNYVWHFPILWQTDRPPGVARGVFTNPAPWT